MKNNIFKFIITIFSLCILSLCFYGCSNNKEPKSLDMKVSSEANKIEKTAMEKPKDHPAH